MEVGALEGVGVEGGFVHRERGAPGKGSSRKGSCPPPVPFPLALVSGEGASEWALVDCPTVQSFATHWRRFTLEPAFCLVSRWVWETAPSRRWGGVPHC